MKPKTQISIVVSCFLAFALGNVTSLGQSTASPGPEHDNLRKMEGTWNAKIKMEDTESSGTAIYKMECGGLWLMSDFKSEFGGQSFHGRGMDGYDPIKKKYVSVWVDSMSTHPMFMEGTFDKDKQTMTMTGEGRGPDGSPVKHKMVTKVQDDDHHTFTMYVVTPNGEEMKIMTIEYTRKK